MTFSTGEKSAESSRTCVSHSILEAWLGLTEQDLVIDKIRIFTCCNLCLVFSENEKVKVFPRLEETWIFVRRKKKSKAAAEQDYFSLTFSG